MIRHLIFEYILIFLDLMTFLFHLMDECVHILLHYHFHSFHFQKYFFVLNLFLMKNLIVSFHFSLQVKHSQIFINLRSFA